MDAVLYHGSQEDREDIRKYEFGYVSRKNADGYKMQVRARVIVTC
jgi:ABC-type phosphonate transport system ATPase subunit